MATMSLDYSFATSGHHADGHVRESVGFAAILLHLRQGRHRETTLSRTLCLMVLAGLLPGCALIQPTAPYAGLTAPGRRQEPNGSVVLPAESQPDRGPLTLDEAIAVALANNPELAATTHDLAAADAQHDVAKSQRLPSVHAVSGYSRYSDGQRAFPAEANGEPGVFSRDLFTGELVLSLPLFTGGRITREIKAATLLRAAAEHRLARTREELVFNVSSLFYSILAQRQVIESLEFSRTTLREHLRRVQDLIVVQKAAKLDQLRVEVRVADLAQRLARECNVQAIQTRVLANLLGLVGQQVLDPVGTLELTASPIVAPDQAVVVALAGRPDYLAARAALEAQAEAVDAARAGRWPTVVLQGAYGGRWAANPTDRPAGLDRADDVGRVGIAVDVPIFDGGRIKAKVREQREKFAAAQERLRKLEMQVRLDVEAAVLTIDSAAERVTATEKAVEQARESLRIEREKYDLGKGSISDVLDAQSALLDTQTSYYRSLADHSVALAQLKLATGVQP
jgi:outer membrane protein TolC